MDKSKKMNARIAKAILAISFALMGCVTESQFQAYTAGKPLEDYPYKTGATYASLTNDMTNCKIEAAQRVPQQMVSYTTPTYTTPVQTYCNRIGTQTFCNSSGGQTHGGQTTVSDANEGLRYSAYNQCLARQGYRFVDIPACAKGIQATSLRVAKNGGLLPLSKKMCIRDRSQ